MRYIAVAPERFHNLQAIIRIESRIVSHDLDICEFDK